MPLGDRHADRGGNTLAERAGGRLDARQHEILGVAGAWAAQLPEVADVVHRRPRVAGEVQQRINQHRTMASRQDEAVAVRRSEENTSELQSLMRISYAVF